MRNTTEDFTFSQSSLQDYLDCARRFELRYLLQQRWPAPEVDDMLRFEEHLAQGERFHRLVQQHQAGVPEAVFRQHLTDPDLRDWFERYLLSGYAVPGEGKAEVLLTVPVGDHTLTAKYDLVLLRDGHAIIVDWKTAQRVPTESLLQQRAQTLVYPYVLAKGGSALNNAQPIAPDQITMVYWYVASGQMRIFRYSAEAYTRTDAQLTALMDEIDRADTFPLTDDVRRCRYCVYRSLCDRGIKAGDMDDYDADEPNNIDSFTLDLDQIAEIEF